MYTLFYHRFWQEEVTHRQLISASAGGTDRHGYHLIGLTYLFTAFMRCQAR